MIDWSCSGERIVGRSDFAEIQARYPTNWPTSYEPLPGREDLTRPADRIP